jgi:DNA-binding beta-propeller fold protein YncE
MALTRRRFLALAAAAPFALRTPAALAAPLRLGLVTCDTEERVAVVDLIGAHVLGSIPVLAGPRSIERIPGALALVCHTDRGSISILDGRRAMVRDQLDRFEEPRYTAAHPDGMHAFVTDSAQQTVTAVDVLHGRIVGRVRLPGPARHVTLARGGHTLWVALGSDAAHVAIVDVRQPRRPSFVSALRPPYLAHDVGFAPDAEHVWVTAGKQGTIGRYGSDGRLGITHVADPGPQHVSFGPRVVYVTSGVAGTFRVHDQRNGRLLRLTNVPTGSYNVQAGPGGLVLTPSLDHGTLCILDARGRLLHTVHVAASSHDACFVA